MQEIERNDITPRNIMISDHVLESGEHRQQVVVIDFGASQRLTEPPSAHMAGNKGRSDVYTIMCGILGELYPRHMRCRLELVPMSRQNIASMEYALLSILHLTWERRSEPDFTQLAELIQAAKFL